VTVTARLPSGDFREAKTVVQVHAISWTVVLQPDVRRADINTPILFEARMLPSSPAPERARYWFYFDDDKKAVISNTPTVRRSFPGARTHWALVVVKDADGHSFKSDAVGVIVVAPVWPWAMASVAGLAILGLGGLQVARKIATTSLSYDWTADVRGKQRITVVPGGVVEAGFELRIVRPPIDASARCAGAIVKRIERLI
jgi:hypothetical protein